MKKKTLGTVIAELRKEKNMTQLDLAEQMGVTDKAVSKWERNLSCPDINSLPKLAQVLGVSVDELMQIKTGSDEKSDRSEIKGILTLILKVLPLAMGVAVTVLSVIKQIDALSGLTLLGVGMFCLALEKLVNNKG